MADHFTIYPHRARRLFSRVISVASMLLVVCCFFFCPSGHAAQYFERFTPELHASEHGLEVGLQCAISDESALRTLLKDGAVIELSIDLSLEKQRSYWLNSSVTSKSLISTLRHNPLTREFSLSVPKGEGSVTLRDKNLSRLLHSCWMQMRFQLLSATELQALEPDSTYLLEVTLRLYHADIPPWLENSMGFWSAEIIPAQTKSLPFLEP